MESNTIKNTANFLQTECYRRKLSVVVITKNAEKFIAGCIESVEDIADEIIVVDGCSSDNTVAIAKSYNVKIVEFEEAEDFAAARNKGTDSSNGDWILQLDADERVTPGMSAALRAILMDAKHPYVAYRFRRSNYFLGRCMKHGGWYHYSLHLFMKEFARYQGLLHERLIVNGQIGLMQECVQHYPYNFLSEFLPRHVRYSRLVAKEIDTGVIKAKHSTDYMLKIRPIKMFWKLFVKKRGFLDGIVGYIFCVLYAYVNFLNWARYWDTYEKSHQSVDLKVFGMRCK